MVQQHRFPSLDGIRGIAILLVLFYHVNLLSRPAGVFERALDTVINSWWIGVDLFFVLSGFLITRILLGKKGEDGYFKNFYMRRVLRIFPVYYLTLAFFLILLPLLMPIDEVKGYSTVLDHQSWFWSYLQNFGLIVHGNFLPADFLAHTWSLAIEEQFYLLWPVLVFFTPRKWFPKLCLGLIVFSFIVRLALYLQGDTETVFIYNTFSHMDPLACGALVAWFTGEYSLSAQWKRLIKGIAVVVAVILMGHVVFQEKFLGPPIITYVYGTLLLSILFGSIILLLVDTERHPAWLSRGPFPFFGKYSYALYVYHWPILFFLIRSREIKNFLGAYSFSSFCLLTGIYLAASILLAMLSWTLIERPILGLKKAFA